MKAGADGAAGAARHIMAPPAHARTMETAVAVAAVAAIWAVAVSQWVAADLIVSWDSKNQFYPFFRFMARAIHDGATPFWNPYHYGGHPSLADPQSLILSPAFVLWALFDPAPSQRAFDLIVFAHVLAGGMALALYGRRRGWPAAACVLAAAVFMLGGPASGRAQHVGVIVSYAWFPIALLLLEVALAKRSRAAAIGCAVATAMVVLGRSQVSFLLGLLLIVFAVHHVATAEKPWAYLRSRLPLLGGMALTAAAIVAVPLLLSMQFALLSNRHRIALDVALMSSLYPLNFANMLVPNVFGSLLPHGLGHWGPSAATRPGLDVTDSDFNYLFMGSLTALLLLWHGIAGGRAFVAGRRLLVAVAIVAAVYAAGRATPLFALMFESVPGVAMFRRPVDATFILTVALAILAGHLTADYVRRGVPQPPWWATAAMLACVAALLAWAVVFSGGSAKAWPAAIEIAKAVPVYLALIAILALARAPRARAVAAGLAVLVTAGELVVRNAASELNGEARWYYGVLERPTGEDLRIVQAIERAVAAERKGAVRPRVEIVGLGGPWQNAAMVHGFEATTGYNPMRIGAYDLLLAPGEEPWSLEHRTFPASFPRYGCALSRLLGLQFVVLGQPIERMRHLKELPAADLVMAGPKAWIYRLREVAPRVSLANVVRVASADDFVRAGQFPSPLPTEEVWIDDAHRLAQSYAGGGQGVAGKAEIVQWRPDRTEIAVETATSAILTLHALWYPGWEVEVDGVSRPLLRTDVLFRGVEVPPGAHRVVFAFRPLSVANIKAALAMVWGAQHR